MIVKVKMTMTTKHNKKTSVGISQQGLATLTTLCLQHQLSKTDFITRLIMAIALDSPDAVKQVLQRGELIAYALNQENVILTNQDVVRLIHKSQEGL